MNLTEEFQADGCELKRIGSTWMCKCPFHGEDTESCSVHETHFKCFGCGNKGDVLTYLSLKKFNRPKCEGADFIEVLREGCLRVGIEFPENDKKPKEPEKPKSIYTLEKLKQCCEWQAAEHQEAVTEYNEATNPETGKVEFVEVRIEHKTKKRVGGKPSKRFLQCAAVEGGFIFGLNAGKKTPLFNRTRIRESQIVVVVEGAKCMRYLHALGVVACAAAGGSNNPVTNVDWEPLRGKTIVIWPDNDKGGLEFASEVRSELEKLDCIVSIVDVADLSLEPKDDVVDFCERIEGDKDKKRKAVEEIVDNFQAETLESQIAADINGTRYALNHPSFAPLATTLCFLPGTITMLCANPGVSKSLLILQWIWQMYFDGIDCSLLALESGNVFHERRILAQMSGNNKVLNPEWCMNNVHEIAQIIDTYKHFTDTIRKQKVVQSPKDGQEVNSEYLISWIKGEAKRGRQLIVIDPITMMETGPQFWEEQKIFVRNVKHIIRKTQIRLMLVTHPRKGSQGPHLDNMAGAVAFSQNTDTALWMEAHDTNYQEIRCENDPMRTENKKYNRIMRLLKNRLGPAKTPQIGLFLDGGTLKHEMIGFIE